MKKIVYKGKIGTIEKEEFKAEGVKFLIERVKGPDAVVISAFLNKNTILLERIYRPVIKKYIYELPAGKVDEKEGRKHAAERELREETGYIARNMKFLSSGYVSPGTNVQMYHFYKATKLIKSRQQLSKSEIIKIMPIKLTDALKMIKSSRIIDAKTIAGILFIAQDIK